jgi:hypothetical protein
MLPKIFTVPSQLIFPAIVMPELMDEISSFGFGNADSATAKCWDCSSADFGDADSATAKRWNCWTGTGSRSFRPLDFPNMVVLLLIQMRIFQLA